MEKALKYGESRSFIQSARVFHPVTSAIGLPVCGPSSEGGSAASRLNRKPIRSLSNGPFGLVLTALLSSFLTESVDNMIS